MSVDLVIRSGSVVTPSGVVLADVVVQGGQIIEISPDVSAKGREEINAGGLHVFPGVIDSHVHFNEPGRGDWEGLDTGSSALAAGGGTAFFDMPLNSSPPVLDGKTFDDKVAAALASSRTDFGIWGGLTPANLDKLDELAARGVVGFKAFMSNSGISDFEHADDFTLYRGMKIAAKYGLIVAVHAENDSITGGLSNEASRQGRTGISDYLASRPAIAEVEAIERAVLLATDAGCRLHVVHVSSAAGAAAVRKAQLAGKNVSYETCPHYLMLGEGDLSTLGARAKCAPPLRPPADVKALWSKYVLGEIDFVASDHSPAPDSMKQDTNFFKVWGGIAGVQSTLGAMLTLTPHLRVEQVAGYTAGRVAQRFGVKNKGKLVVGYDADMAIVDLAASYTLTREGLFDRHKLSPYVGRTFRGAIHRTILRGRTIFHEGKLTTAKGGGKLLRPTLS